MRDSKDGVRHDVTLPTLVHEVQELVRLKHTSYDVAFAEAAQVKLVVVREIPLVRFPGLSLLNALGRTGAGEIVMFHDLLSVEAPLAAVALMVNGPDVVGRPEIVPFVARESPLGSPVAVQVYVPVPPEACSVAE